MSNDKEKINKTNTLNDHNGKKWMNPILSVKDLRVYYRTILKGNVRAVDGVSFDLAPGEILGLAGESGCGKSTLGHSLLRIIQLPGYYAGGQIIFQGTDIVTLPEEEMRKFRMRKIAWVSQAIMNSFNPVIRIRSQVRDLLEAHNTHRSLQEMLDRFAELLEAVNISRNCLNSYPHELSGGMRQRVAIALALLLNPKILIADEPTTALDVVVQKQLLRLIRDLTDKLTLSVLIISHDISILGEISDRLAIMYAGKLVEMGPKEKVGSSPRHPYTHALLRSIPSLTLEKQKIRGIPGQPPDLDSPPAGCRFNPRCPYAIQICRKEEPVFKNIDTSWQVACHRYEDIIGRSE